jgi:hypothetical protein
MRGPAVLACLFAVLLPPALAKAEGACLPASLFSQSEASDAPTLDLGFVEKAPTLCASNDRQQAGLLGCWTIDPATGAMSSSPAAFLPGHSQIAKTDANGCIEGSCVPEASADELLAWVVSTSGERAAILRENTVYVFDVKTKTRTGAIPLFGNGVPDATSVGNQPIRIFYIGDTLYVVGADAGPYIAVWSFKDDGRRTGLITTTGKAGDPGYSVYNGAVNIVDETHIALADAGLRTMLVLSAIDGKREVRTRPVSLAPCTRQETENVYLGDFDALSKRCRKTVAETFEPYIDLVPIRLPSGDFLAALSGKGRGSLAILDGKTLAEKRRFRLPRCAH